VATPVVAAGRHAAMIENLAAAQTGGLRAWRNYRAEL